MGKKWTNNDFNFLKENYPKKGVQYCSEKLNRTEKSIQTMTNKLNIKLSKEIKSKILKQSHIKDYSKYKVNPKHFLQIETKEVAYFLGIMWADGSVCKKSYNIKLEIIKDDLDSIITHLDNIGKWNTYERNRNNWKVQKSISTNNYHIHNFFKKNEYFKKSIASPNEILSKIPDNLKHYFFRGLVDGDGNWQDKNGNYSFCIAGDKKQNWNSVELIFNNCGIHNFKIRQESNKKGEGSIIKITNKKDITKFGDYIYKNYENDKLGFPRKYEVYKTIKEKSLVDRYLSEEQRNKAREKNLGTKNPNYKNVDVDKIKLLRKKGWSLKKIANTIGVSTTIISSRLKID